MKRPCDAYKDGHREGRQHAQEKEVQGMKDAEGFIIIERLEDIPQTMSEAEEAEFWSTHTLSDALLEEMQPVPLEGDDKLPPAKATRGASR